jgi:hypothetical protein
MSIEENATHTGSENQVTLPKSKETLLAEETEKALGDHKQKDAETMRAVELMKGELQQKMDTESHHKVD